MKGFTVEKTFTMTLDFTKIHNKPDDKDAWCSQCQEWVNVNRVGDESRTDIYCKDCNTIIAIEYVTDCARVFSVHKKSRSEET